MYSVRILRRAIKEIADLPKGYAHLVGEHIDRLQKNPRPPGANVSFVHPMAESRKMTHFGHFL